MNAPGGLATPERVASRVPLPVAEAPWVLRWEARRQAAPELAFPRGAAATPAHVDLLRLEDGSFFLVDGYVFGTPGAGHVARPSAARLLADAWRSRGPRLVDDLRGGYTLVVWDAPRRRLLVARDAMGLSPCYYAWKDGLLVVSASQQGVFRQPEVGARPNRARIAEYISTYHSPLHREETFLADVRRLPPAHTLTVAGGTLALERYWDPVPPGFAWATPDEVAAFEPTFERAVARCLDAGADSIALSGGFDSVSVAVVAAEQLAGRKPLHAVSLRFTESVCDEGDTQLAVARTLGMPQMLQTIPESLGGESFLRASLALSRGSPTPVLSAFQSMYTGLLRSATGLGLGRMLMGTGGDDTFNVDYSWGGDLLAGGRLRELWHFYRLWLRTSPFSAGRVAQVVLWDGVLRPEARRFARRSLGALAPGVAERARRRAHEQAIPRWISAADPALAEELLERRLSARAPETAPGERTYVQTLRGLTQAPLLLMELDQGYAWAERMGITLMYPYFDRDLVELTLRMHPETLMVGGLAKAPLRRLVAERLPSLPLRKKKVDFTQEVHQVLRPDGRRAWQQMDGPRTLAAANIVSPAHLEPSIEKYFSGTDRYALLMWLVLSTELWLRESF